jgi:hypothetical protein
MKKRRQVLSRNNIPTGLPVVSTLVWFLTMERFNAPAWLWGTMGTILALGWIGSIYNLVTEKETELL